METGKATDGYQSSRNHVREQTRAVRVLKTLPSGKPESHTEKRRGKPIRPQCDPDHSPYSRNQQKNRDWICASKISQRAVTGDRCRRESGSKGQVSDSKRRALYKIGFEEISRAIDRYLTELQKDAAWRKPQNGSTFFNSGYVDYLDDNFVPDKKPEAQANTYQQQQSSYLDSIRNRVKMVDEWYANTDESNEPTMWDLIDEKEE